MENNTDYTGIRNMIILLRIRNAVFHILTLAALGAVVFGISHLLKKLEEYVTKPKAKE